MGKKLANPRHRVLSFRASETEYMQIISAKPAGPVGPFLLSITLTAVLSSPLPSPAQPASDHNGGVA